MIEKTLQNYKTHFTNLIVDLIHHGSTHTSTLTFTLIAGTTATAHSGFLGERGEIGRTASTVDNTVEDNVFGQFTLEIILNSFLLHNEHGSALDRNLVGELKSGRVDSNSGNHLGLFIDSYFNSISIHKGNRLVEGNLVGVSFTSEDVERRFDGHDRRNGNF